MESSLILTSCEFTASKSTKSNQDANANINNNDLNENDDDILYKRIYDKCKKLFEQLVFNNLSDNGNSLNNSDCSSNNSCNSGNNTLLNSSLYANETVINNNKHQSNHNLLDDQFKQNETNLLNSQLLALECILNLNLSKKNESLSDWYKNEIRELNVLDKLLKILKLFVDTFKSTTVNGNKLKNYYLISKYAKYIQLIQTVTHRASSSSPSKSSSQSSPTSSFKGSNTNLSVDFNATDLGAESFSNIGFKKQTASASFSASSTSLNCLPLSCSTLNQNYLLEYNQSFLLDLIKQSLNVFYDELEFLSKESNQSNQSVNLNKSIITNAIKQTFLGMINLTLYNENTTKKIIKDEELVDLLFQCIAKVITFTNEEEQFDVLITAFGILLNIFDVNFKNEESFELIKEIKSLKCSSFEIIVNLYKTKEALVSLAETDQDNQLKQLNQQIESQNVENINLTVMNSIHKAGKHMEEHIIAAHSALVIGYMLLADQTEPVSKNNKTKKSIDIEKLKLEMKDNSFQNMSKIIVKFLEFMKMMKVSGFSLDEHIKAILNYLEQIG